MVYLVVEGEYSDWHVFGYFKNELDAENYCLLKNSEDEYDEYYVLPIEELNIDISKIDMTKRKEYYIVFYNDIGITEHTESPDIYVGEKRKVRFRCKFNSPNPWFMVIVTADNKNKARKIAQDYYAEFKYNVGTFGEKFAIELMNIDVR